MNQMDATHIGNLALVAMTALGMLWVAVPLGLTLGLPTWLVALICIPCSVFGASLVILLIHPFRGFVRRHFSERNRRGQVRYIFRIWRRTGLPGLGVLGPLLAGPPPTMAIGLLLGAPPARLLAWTAFGISVWTGFMIGAWILCRDLFF